MLVVCLTLCLPGGSAAETPEPDRPNVLFITMNVNLILPPENAGLTVTLSR